MKKSYDLSYMIGNSDKLIVVVDKKRKREIISIYYNNEKTLLEDYYNDGIGDVVLRFDKDFIYTLYSYNFKYLSYQDNKPNLHIKSIYSIKDKKKVSLKDDNNLRNLFDYIYAKNETFPLPFVLELINDCRLNIISFEILNDSIISYLTNDNTDISTQDIKLYILNCYPKLKKYTNLSSPFSILDYYKIEEDLGKNNLSFNKMPQLAQISKQAVRTRK